MQEIVKDDNITSDLRLYITSEWQRQDKMYIKSSFEMDLIYICIFYMNNSCV